MDDAPANPTWSRAGLIAFRFSCVYWLLYNLDFPLGLFDSSGAISEKYTSLWLPIIKWVGAHILHVPYEIEVLPNGSGDTTFNYVQVFCFLCLSVLGTVVWSVLDRKRTSYARLYEWVRVLLRYVLFMTMLSYGWAKVFYIQFPPPGPVRLLESFGDSSPMGLLWTFMGYSQSYSFFAGFAEVLGGLLLLFRRTTTLGALVVAGVMTNVAIMNFCFDVPVKLYSSHLLLMAAFLLLPDLKRLLNFFVLNRPTEPAQHYNPSSSPRWIHLGSKALLIAITLYLGLSDAISARAEFGAQAPKPALYGLWQVTTSDSPWMKVAFDTFDRIAFQDKTGQIHRGKVTLDPVKKTVQMAERDTSNVFTFTYEEQGDLLTLKGNVPLTLSRVDMQNLPLMNRGFHWINEMPFNR